VRGPSALLAWKSGDSHFLLVYHRSGIVVRNSIILVDSIQLRFREGMPLDQAVIDAGAVRFRPMMITAAAVIVGLA
jgi:multidrug efflux pump subunit AcrB